MNLNKKRHKLDVAYYKLQKRNSEYINDLSNRCEERSFTGDLLQVVSYLNLEQNGLTVVIDKAIDSETIILKGRTLNSHEEDLYNTAIQTLKRLIQIEGANAQANCPSVAFKESP